MANLATTKRPTALWAVPALVALATLSGCMGFGEEKSDTGPEDNEAPNAELDVNRTSGWANERFLFEAADSEDPDGEIRNLRFDFGDGTVMEVDPTVTTNVTHGYVRGGEFTVTLTVFDNAQESAGSLTDTDSVRIAVNEGATMPSQLIFAAPTNATETPTFTYPVDVYGGADRLVSDVDIQSSLLVGSSEIRLRLLDPDNETLDEETVVVSAGQSKSVQLGTDVDQIGQHRLEIAALSGGATVAAEFDVLYDEGY